MRLQPTLLHARRALFATALFVSIHACASAPARPVVPKGDIDLSLAMPSPTASPFGLSQGQQLAAYAPQDVNIDEFLLPTAPKAAKADAPKLAATKVSRRPAVEKPAVVIAEPALLAAVEQPMVAAQPTLAAPDANADATRYAQREDKKNEAYRGGDAIVIGASTILIVLLIVLLILLLR